MSLPGVEAVVRERLGLDPEALGATALSRAVAQRMNATRATTTDEYLGFVFSNLMEQQSLAAELVVPETWFFRGGRALFDALAGFVSAKIATRTTKAPVRVLSIPCSTGEEPYSLSIALHEHAILPAGYVIEAVDISEAHLARARAACFSTFSFRETGPDIRTTHFQQVGDRWELRSALRESVRFSTGNVTDPCFLAGDPPFDLILCRNLFIYLTVESRQRVMMNFDRLLAVDGRLALSPAEADRLPSKRFVAAGPLEFGIYRRVVASATPAQNSSLASTGKPLSRSVAVNTQQRTRQVEKAVTVARPEPVDSPNSLEAARKLADAGQLAAARVVCERLLSQTTGDPNIYSLLGEILLSEGRAGEAAEAFRKALYLHPVHLDALSHMIVICEGKGDTVQAESLRSRLKRLTQKEPK